MRIKDDDYLLERDTYEKIRPPKYVKIDRGLKKPKKHKPKNNYIIEARRKYPNRIWKFIEGPDWFTYNRYKTCKSLLQAWDHVQKDKYLNEVYEFRIKVKR